MSLVRGGEKNNHFFVFWVLTNSGALDIIIKHVAELCNGSTTDSDSVCEGSNPSSATTKGSSQTLLPFCFGV